MKLLNLRLYNFRPFYGEHGLSFAKTADRNITVIHGNNGSGKTALLNAFTWALYERFTAALASPDQLVNRRALAEAAEQEAVPCWVEVAFDHDGKQYRVRRSCQAFKRGDEVNQSTSQVEMQFVGDDGRWSTLPAAKNPDDVVGRMLPKSLHQYFFFDGERIEQLVRTDNRAEIAEATQKLLGVKVLDNAIKHLNAARKTLEDELSSIGDAETKSLLAQRREKESARDALEARQEEIDQELTHQATLKQEYNLRLGESGEFELQRRRMEQLSEQERELRDRLQEAKKILKQAISNRGYTVFLPSVIEKFRAIVQDKEERGELPADVKPKFVQDLLECQRCICGTELHPGTSHRKAVETWLQKTGLADVQSTLYRLEGWVNQQDDQQEDFWRQVDQEQATINHCKQKLSQIETDLEDLRDQLRTSPREDIRQLQERIDEVDRKSEDLILEKGRNQERVAVLSTEVTQLRKQVRDRKQNQGRQKLALQRIEAAQEAIDRLKELKQNQDILFRQELQDTLSALYGEISFKAYIPRISEKYELNLVERVGNQEVLVGASTGENQILSLSFIGSVVERIRQWSENKLVMGPDSSTFPLVMDSPFGSLDEIYRRQVAKLLPGLADQLIVMASKTQWRGEVEDEMLARIGREYVLIYNSPKDEVQGDMMQIGGETYPLIRQSPDEFEFTEIVEVHRHG
ncbi:AAA family ATPase [Nodosilinea sp. LEGE 07088]|uniref:AAA family ATPase n=1 Tax=Nodosilinea sp. LEGE 07088 TaxID=2777968 RepID=UPI00187DEECE|nr:AAA family ATPase [Nodosilinea sp. LEGE 07088]MBE9139746.1 AAA family ATPase [Nodosilinea sp. LEGE 07088]